MPAPQPHPMESDDMRLFLCLTLAAAMLTHAPFTANAQDADGTKPADATPASAQTTTPAPGQPPADAPANTDPKADGNAAEAAPAEGDTPPADGKRQVKLPGLVVDLDEKYVDVDAVVCLDNGMLELIACTADTKEHESIIKVSARPMHIHAGLLLLGANNGNPAISKRIDKEGEEPRWIHLPPRGDKIDVTLVFADIDGDESEYPIGDFIRWADKDDQMLGFEEQDGEPRVFPSTFLFAGSVLHVDDKGNRHYLADTSGHVITIATFGDELLCLPLIHSTDNGALVWEVNPEILPEVGTKVKMRLRKAKKAEKEGAEATATTEPGSPTAAAATPAEPKAR